MSGDLAKEVSINSAGDQQDNLKSNLPAWIIYNSKTVNWECEEGKLM